VLILDELQESIETLLKLQEAILRSPKRSYGPGTKSLAACLVMTSFVSRYIHLKDMLPCLVQNEKALMQAIHVDRQQVVQHGFGYGSSIPSDSMLLRYQAETDQSDRLILVSQDEELDLKACVVMARQSTLGPKRWMPLPPPFWVSMGVPFCQRVDRENLGSVLADNQDFFKDYDHNVYSSEWDVKFVEPHYDMLSILPAFLYAINSHGAEKAVVHRDGDAYTCVRLNGVIL